MNSARDTRQVALPGGLPHSEIPGSTIARISPGLFAACHVLHRLSVPRHPPDALDLRLIPTRRQKSRQQKSRQQGPPIGKAVQTAAHRDKTRPGQNPLGTKSARDKIRSGQNPANTATSHEDTSSDTAAQHHRTPPGSKTSRNPGTQVPPRAMSASVTSQLSLHPSIIAPAPAPPKPATPRAGSFEQTASPSAAPATKRWWRRTGSNR
jgi:hypothetical protein